MSAHLRDWRLCGKQSLLVFLVEFSKWLHEKSWAARPSADALAAAFVTAVPGPQHSGLHKLNFMQAYHTCVYIAWDHLERPYVCRVCGCRLWGMIMKCRSLRRHCDGPGNFHGVCKLMSQAVSRALLMTSSILEKKVLYW